VAVASAGPYASLHLALADSNISTPPLPAAQPTSSKPLASTPPGMPGHITQYFGWGTSTGISPPILLCTFGYSRPILVALRSLSVNPISYGYKTPPIRFSQAGAQSAHKARPPNLELALTPLVKALLLLYKYFECGLCFQQNKCPVCSLPRGTTTQQAVCQARYGQSLTLSLCSGNTIELHL